MVTWPSEPVRAVKYVWDYIDNFDQLERYIKEANDGDTLDLTFNYPILVFERHIEINKSITLNLHQSKDYKRTKVYADTVRLFTITSNNVRLNFDDIGFECNVVPGKGGAIAIYGNNVSVDGGHFSCRGGRAVEYGGAIYVAGKDASISNTGFSGYSSCVANRGGAIYVDGRYATIRNCFFTALKSYKEGGAIYVNRKDALIMNCIFRYCESEDNDAGAIFVNASDATVRDCHFLGCKAPSSRSDGGAIKLSYTPGYTGLKVENCIFENCFAQRDGKWVDGGKSTTITHCSRPYNDTNYYKCTFSGDLGCKKNDIIRKDSGHLPTCTKDGWATYYQCWCGLCYSDPVPSARTRIAGSFEELVRWTRTPESAGGGYRPAKGHDFEHIVEGNTITAKCKNDPEHRVSLNLAVRDTVYSGKAENVEISGNINHADWNKYGFDYGLEYVNLSTGAVFKDAPVDVGRYNAVIFITKEKGSGWLKHIQKGFEIKRKPISKEFTKLDRTLFKYDGTEKRVNLTVMDGDKRLIEGTDYIANGHFSDTQIGAHSIKIEGIRNYTDSVTETWYITEPDPLRLEGTLTSTPITYGEKLGNSTISFSGNVMSGDMVVTGKFAWEDPHFSPKAGEGTYTVEFTPDDRGGKYGILDIELKVTVNPRDLSGISPDNIFVPDTYIGSELKDYIIVLPYVERIFYPRKGLDYDVSTSPAQVINPGKYTATIDFKGNFKGSATKEFTVKRYVGGEDVTVDAPAYTGEELNEYITVMLDGKSIEKGKDYDISFSPNPVKDIGEYTAEIVFDGHGYNCGTITKKFSVTSTPIPTPTPTPTPSPTPAPSPVPTPVPTPPYSPSYTPSSSASQDSGNTGGTISDGTYDNVLKINVTTKNGNAVISNIPAANIEKIADTAEKPIVIDVSGSGSDGKKVSRVTILKATVENLLVALNTPVNVKDRFVIITDTAVMKFDTKAFTSIAGQAKGENMQIVLEEKSQDKLNNNQKSELKNFDNMPGMEVAQVFEALITSGGSKITDFEGGRISIGKIDFNIPEGTDAGDYSVYYLPDKGTAELCNTWVEDGMVFFGTGHFSDYAIVYDESLDVEVYRLYNNKTGEHLLTADEYEVRVLTEDGWTKEPSPGYGAKEGVEVYRLFNPATGEHLYSADKNECDKLTKDYGWEYDNNGKPIIYGFTSGKAMYRLFNISLPEIASHHYTSDINEVKVLTTERGYVSDNEGEAVFYLN